eukprot:Gb_30763 [translate_table: standard]
MTSSGNDNNEAQTGIQRERFGVDNFVVQQSVVGNAYPDSNRNPRTAIPASPRILITKPSIHGQPESPNLKREAHVDILEEKPMLSSCLKKKKTAYNGIKDQPASYNKVKKQVNLNHFPISELDVSYKDWLDAPVQNPKEVCVICGKQGGGGHACCSLPQKEELITNRTSNDDSSSSDAPKLQNAKNGGKLQWEIEQLIGQGSSATVYKGLNKTTGELMAVKKIKIRNNPRAWRKDSVFGFRGDRN